MQKRTLLTPLLGIALSALFAPASNAQTPPVTASGPSPFNGCSIGGSGTLYPNSEVEP